MIRRLFLAGASGDLATRYLGPALAALQLHDQLPSHFSVTGLARSDWDTKTFRERIVEGIEEHAPAMAEAVGALRPAIAYQQADVTEAADVRRVLAGVDEPIVFYLAIPPQILSPVVRALVDLDLPEGSRIVVEKPFGADLESARELNELLRGALPEAAVFRVDHFLAEQAVQNLLALRFANRTFEPLWNREHVERVDIVWDETLALEGRAGYYDSAGGVAGHGAEPPPASPQRHRDGAARVRSRTW